MVKINKALLPIKAHYFFFMAGKFMIEIDLLNEDLIVDVFKIF